MRKVLALAVVAGLLLFAACEQSAKPTVTIVFPTDGATIGFGGTTIKATATDDKGVTKVEFFDGSASIGVDSTATVDTFSVSWSGGTAGSHTLKAVATNDDGATAEHSITVTMSSGNATHHNQNIDADETWYPSGNPHFIDATIGVINNATLTIKPGCYVQFSGDCELRCGYGSQQGAIVAVGTADSLITFTSGAASPQPGDWSEIGVYAAAMASTQFKYCKFEYAGSSAGYGTVYVYGAVIKLDYCSIGNSADRGVVVEGDGKFSSFTNNTITTCVKYPVEIQAAYGGTLGAGSTLTGNASGYDGIELTATTVEETQTWLNHGVPYVIMGTMGVQGSSSPILTIAAGTTVKLGPGVEFRCGHGSQSGAISAIGTASQRITFTSSATDPAPGSWSEIGIYNAATNATQFTYCDFSYAGSSAAYGAFYLYGASPKFDNCNISQSGDYGVVVEGDGKFSSFTNNAITTCAKYPINIQANYAGTLGAGNPLTGNASGYDGVELDGDFVTENQTWLNHGVPYILDGLVGVEGSSSPELTIAPGSTVKLRNGVEFRCGYGSEPGAIIADGTSERITITCAATPPAPGSWNYISFYDAALTSSKLVNCNIMYGGDGYGNIYVYNAKPTISGDSIGYSDSYGIYLDGDTLNLPKPATLRANNTFYSNASGDVREP